MAKQGMKRPSVTHTKSENEAAAVPGLQGKAKLTYEGREYFLDEGDSVTFSAAVPHHLENIGDTELKAIWTVTPAQRFVK